MTEISYRPGHVQKRGVVWRQVKSSTGSVTRSFLDKKRLLMLAVSVLVTILLLTLILFLHLRQTLEPFVLPKDTAHIAQTNITTAVVPGASINGVEPSPILQERLDRAIELYRDGVITQILISGDAESDNGNEVDVMWDYLNLMEIPTNDILKDGDAKTTYDTCRNAVYRFGLDEFLIVTQRFHIYRSLYMCRSFSVNALGVATSGSSWAHI